MVFTHVLNFEITDIQTRPGDEKDIDCVQGEVIDSVLKAKLPSWRNDFAP